MRSNEPVHLSEPMVLVVPIVLSLNLNSNIAVSQTITKNVRT